MPIWKGYEQFGDIIFEDLAKRLAQQTVTPSPVNPTAPVNPLPKPALTENEQLIEQTRNFWEQQRAQSDAARRAGIASDAKRAQQAEATRLAQVKAAADAAAADTARYEAERVAAEADKGAGDKVVSFTLPDGRVIQTTQAQVNALNAQKVAEPTAPRPVFGIGNQVIYSFPTGAKSNAEIRWIGPDVAQGQRRIRIFIPEANQEFEVTEDALTLFSVDKVGDDTARAKAESDAAAKAAAEAKAAADAAAAGAEGDAARARAAEAEAYAAALKAREIEVAKTTGSGAATRPSRPTLPGIDYKPEDVIQPGRRFNLAYFTFFSIICKT